MASHKGMPHIKKPNVSQISSRIAQKRYFGIATQNQQKDIISG